MSLDEKVKNDLRNEIAYLERELDAARAEISRLQELSNLNPRALDIYTESVRLRAALDDAISLTYVAEHARDDEWYARLEACKRALGSGQGEDGEAV